MLGRPCRRTSKCADRLGYLDIPDGLLVSLNEAKMMSDYEIVFLRHGSQGESRAALSQMATQSYKGLMVEEVTRWCCRRIIPGNERLISRMIGFIYKARRQHLRKAAAGPRQAVALRRKTFAS